MQSSKLDLSSWWVEVASVPTDAHPYDVFEQLAENPDVPFVPVVDADGRPVGVVRERKLKTHAYSQFGRSLLRKRKLAEFIEDTLVVPHDIQLDVLLTEGSERNPNPDGIVVTKDGAYRAILLNHTLLHLHEERHVETKVRLANAEKMEAIGTLAGGIAHDLNNILTPILNYAEMIRDSVTSGEAPELGMIDEILLSSKRAQQTVRRILSFSRQQDTERSIVALKGIVQEVAGLIRASVPSTIDVEIEFETDSDAILGNPGELHQVLMNICTNAYHAMVHSHGRLRISVAEHHGALLGWTFNADPVPDQLLRVSVSDTGTGIDAAILPRVFEPFFTTKPQGEGTGMGLAIVHGIIARHRAFISVETSEGNGTTVHLYFRPSEPFRFSSAAARVVNITNTAGHQPAVSRPVIRALVVDDESQILRMARMILSRHGFEVTTDTEGGNAWNLIRQSPTAFDVLITDEMMPGMRGSELAQRVKAIRPDMPIVICTGYAENFSLEQSKALGIHERIIKPFDYRRLAEKIRDWFSEENRFIRPAQLSFSDSLETLKP